MTTDKHESENKEILEGIENILTNQKDFKDILANQKTMMSKLDKHENKLNAIFKKRNGK